MSWCFTRPRERMWNGHNCYHSSFNKLRPKQMIVCLQTQLSNAFFRWKVCNFAINLTIVGSQMFNWSQVSVALWNIIGTKDDPIFWHIFFSRPYRYMYDFRDHSVYGIGKWEPTVHFNVVSHVPNDPCTCSELDYWHAQQHSWIQTDIQ